MIRSHRLVALLVVVSAALVGCETQPIPQFRELTYSQLSPIRLSVDDVEIINSYKSPFHDPFVEHRFPTPPGAVARRWAEDRLVAAGGQGARAVFTILDASVVETKLESTTGVKGIFTKDQSERYDATLAVQLDVFDSSGRRRGTTTVTARESRTAREDLTLNERESLWFEMTETLMDGLNRQLENNIDRFLNGFVI